MPTPDQPKIAVEARFRNIVDAVRFQKLLQQNYPEAYVDFRARRGHGPMVTMRLEAKR